MTEIAGTNSFIDRLPSADRAAIQGTDDASASEADTETPAGDTSRGADTVGEPRVTAQQSIDDALAATRQEREEREAERQERVQSAEAARWEGRAEQAAARAEAEAAAETEAQAPATIAGADGEITEEERAVILDPEETDLDAINEQLETVGDLAESQGDAIENDAEERSAAYRDAFDSERTTRELSEEKARLDEQLQGLIDIDRGDGTAAETLRSQIADLDTELEDASSAVETAAGYGVDVSNYQATLDLEQSILEQKDSVINTEIDAAEGEVTQLVELYNDSEGFDLHLFGWGKDKLDAGTMFGWDADEIDAEIAAQDDAVKRAYLEDAREALERRQELLDLQHENQRATFENINAQNRLDIGMNLGAGVVQPRVDELLATAGEEASLEQPVASEQSAAGELTQEEFDAYVAGSAGGPEAAAAYRDLEEQYIAGSAGGPEAAAAYRGAEQAEAESVEYSNESSEAAEDHADDVTQNDDVHADGGMPAETEDPGDDAMAPVPDPDSLVAELLDDSYTVANGAISTTVDNGDWLAKIITDINSQLGTNLHYNDMYEHTNANSGTITDPNMIYPGQVVSVGIPDELIEFLIEDYGN